MDIDKTKIAPCVIDVEQGINPEWFTIIDDDYAKDMIVKLCMLGAKIGRLDEVGVPAISIGDINKKTDLILYKQTYEMQIKGAETWEINMEAFNLLKEKINSK